MQPFGTPVSTVLSETRNARSLGLIDLGQGGSAAIWRNHNDHVRYDQSLGNTFSYYVRGGEGTRRVDGRELRGVQGSVCILPEGHSSEWEITQPFDFVHLYVSDPELRRHYAEIFDCDARSMELAEITYVDAPSLIAPFIGLQRAIQQENHLLANEAISQLVYNVFEMSIFTKASLPRVGGLAPHKRRRVLDYIEANLSKRISLAELAALVDLSQYHLQRSFTLSCGVSPNTWLQYRRVERAKNMIEQSEPLAQIATACGFSSQSHLTRSFKALTGSTPGVFAAEVGGV